MTTQQLNHNSFVLTKEEANVINHMRKIAKVDNKSKATTSKLPKKPDMLITRLTGMWARNGKFITIGLGSRLTDILRDDVCADGNKTIAVTYYGVKVYLSALPRFKRIMKSWGVKLVLK